MRHLPSMSPCAVRGSDVIERSARGKRLAISRKMAEVGTIRLLGEQQKQQQQQHLAPKQPRRRYCVNSPKRERSSI